MKTLFKTKLVCLLILAASITTCDMKRTPVYLGRAGDVSLTEDELRTYVEGEFRGEKDNLGQEQLIIVTKKLLIRKSLAYEAEKKGFNEKPSVKKDLLMWKIQNYPNYYMQSQIVDKIEIAEDEIRGLINAGDQAKLRVIRFSEDNNAEAWEIYNLLKSGEDFSELARTRSVGISAKDDGYMGWQDIPGTAVTEKAAQVIRELDPGSFTEPIQTPVGWVIFKLEAFKNAEDIVNEKRSWAEETLRQKKRTVVQQQRMNELREKATIVYPVEKAGPGSNAPLAVVNGYAILFNDVRENDSPIHKFTFSDINTQKERLEKFIDNFLMVQEFERLELDQAPEISQKYKIAKIRVLSARMIEESLSKNEPPSEEEARAEYNRTYIPDIYTLQIVFTHEREKAEEALAKIESGEDFGQVSSDYSEARIASNKGLIPPGPLGRYPDDFRREVESLENGSHTEILTNADGSYAIIKRLSHETVEVPPFEQVSEHIKKRIALRKKGSLLQSFMEDYSNNLDISIDEGALEKF